MNIQVTFIDWFGIKPTESQQPPVSTGAAAPYSKQITTTARTIFDKKTYFAFNFAEIAYAPIATQKQFLLEGWSPASMLAVNAMVQNPVVAENSFGNTNLPTTPEESILALLIVWCLNFQEKGTQISTPRVVITVNGESKLIQRKILSWNNALETLGNANLINGSTQALKALIYGKYSAISVPDAIKNLNLSSLEDKKLPSYLPFEIASNWSFWGMGWNGINPIPSWAIPVGSFLLKAKKKTELKSAANKKSETITILNKGETITQTLPIDKAGWWGAVDSNGKYGYISGEDVEIAPFSSEQMVKEITPPPQTTKSKPNTGIYIGIGVSALILASAALFLRKR